MPDVHIRMIVSIKKSYSYVAKFFLMIILKVQFHTFLPWLYVMILCWQRWKPFQIAQTNSIINVIPNENTNFVFKFHEFEFSEFERFGSISHSLITVLLAWTHKKVYINTASINSKKQEAGKLTKCAWH